MLASKTIIIDIDACNGCGECAQACHVDRGRLWLFTKDLHGHLLPTGVCRQCRPSPCLENCPGAAITRKASGVVQVTDLDCNCCSVCVDVCPYNAIFIDWTQVKWSAVKCDLCEGEPECVAVCPTNALVMADVPERVRR